MYNDYLLVSLFLLTFLTFRAAFVVVAKSKVVLRLIFTLKYEHFTLKGLQKTSFL